MKLTLELGMLIICVVLLMVLVASQYTKQSKCNDVKEGFGGLPVMNKSWKRPVMNKTEKQELPVFNKWKNLNHSDKRFLSSYRIASTNPERMQEIMLRLKVNASKNMEDDTIRRQNYCRLMASFNCDKNPYTKLTDCDQDECETMASERKKMVEAKEKTSARYDDNYEYDVILADIVAQIGGSVSDVSDDNYANYCKLRKMLNNCTTGISWCRDECGSGSG